MLENSAPNSARVYYRVVAALSVQGVKLLTLSLNPFNKLIGKLALQSGYTFGSFMHTKVFSACNPGERKMRIFAKVGYGGPRYCGFQDSVIMC